MKDRKTAMQKVLNQLRNIFPQVAVDHLKNIIAGSVGSQEGDLEPEPMLQLCIEHVLDPENAPSQNDIDQDDLELMNGSLDTNTEDETRDEKKSLSRNDSKENGTTAVALEKEENHLDSKTLESSSNTEKLVYEKSPTGQNYSDEAHIPVIKMVKQVMAVFPEADKWWIIKECKDMKLKFEDHSISERICNYMFDNPYPKRGEFKGNNKLIAKGTSKRPHSNDSAEADSSRDHPDSKNTRGLKEPIVPQKIRKITDIDVQSVAKDDPRSRDIVSAEDGELSPPQPSTSRDRQYSSTFRRSDSAERKISCDQCSAMYDIESSAPCYEGHLICKTCIENCVKPIISGTKEGEIKCPVKECDQIIPLGHAKRALPSILVDIMEEKLTQQNIEKLKSSVEGLFKCPHCSFVAYMEPEIKCFTCENDECNKATCRYCEKEWDNPDLHISCSKHTAKGTNSEIKLPDHWQPMDQNHPGYIKVKLNPTSEEYKSIADKFHMVEYANQVQQQQAQPPTFMIGGVGVGGNQFPGPGIQIRSIYRVQNPKLWKIYSLKRQLMLQENGEEELNEYQLFHGTAPNVVDAICAENFDFRLSGAHGTAMGHGIYFATHSSTSLGYCQAGHDGIRHMFLARVLTGRSAQSSPNYRRPPKDKRTGRLFDSVSNGTPLSHTGVTAAPPGGAVFGVGFGGIPVRRGRSTQEAGFGVEVVNDPRNQASVYVIFDPMQHYPEYVISY